jgi:drug/metabolite transporter (DMT)-like permease
VGGLGIKLVDAGGLAIGGYRSLFALPVLLWAMGPRALAQDGPRALARPYVWGAAVSYAVCVVTFAAANKLTFAANAILLQYTAPVHVALLSWPLLREPVRKADWLAIVGCLFGMGLFFRDGVSAGGASTLGNLLALVSSFGFAGLPLLLRLELASLAREGGAFETRAPSPMLALLLGNLLAVLATSPWMLADAPQSAQGWGVVAALGVFQIGLAYVCYGHAVRHLSAVETTLFATVEPLLNPVWVLLGTGERPTPAALLGGLVILGSVTAQGLHRRATKGP